MVAQHNLLMLDARVRSDLSGAFRQSRMLADELDAMIGATVSHLVNSLIRGKALTAQVHTPRGQA